MTGVSEQTLPAGRLQVVQSEGQPPYYRLAPLTDHTWVTHGIFTRHGGVSAPPFDSLNISSSRGDDPQAVDTNRNRVLAALDRPRDGLVMAGLVHGVDVARVDRTTVGQPLDGGGRYLPGVDALITDDPTLSLLISAADCAQVLLLDPQHRAVGLAHAGWRGTVAGVLTATVEALHAAFGSAASDLVAAVGPCLGPCCARFSDPQRELPAWCAPFIHGLYVDLWAMIAAQLMATGLRREAITVAGICTVCRRDIFFSHRGDRGATGRFGAVLALR